MRYAPIDGDEQAAELAEVLSRCFAFPATEAKAWIERSGLENSRVLLEGPRVVAGLIQIPMGQWFGGRVVPTLGIAGVGVAPHLRGRGSAATLMAETIREAFGRRIATSTLYPATVALYRKVGYEIAGSRWETTVPSGQLDLVAGDVEGVDLAPLGEADHDATTRVYRAEARRQAGWLDRGPYVWRRVEAPRADVAHGFGVFEGSKMTGYTYFVQKHTDDQRYALRLTDLCATTPRALRKLLVFFAQHRSVGDEVRWTGAAVSPALALLSERTYALREAFPWMLRIVDVRRALEARGYPACVRADVILRVRDSLLPQNDGRFAVRVRDGRAKVAPDRGAAPRPSRKAAGVALDVAALAPLFTGHRSASQLAALGSLEGPAADVAALDAVFAGPAPSMVDMF